MHPERAMISVANTGTVSNTTQRTGNFSLSNCAERIIMDFRERADSVLNRNYSDGFPVRERERGAVSYTHLTLPTNHRV